MVHFSSHYCQPICYNYYMLVHFVPTSFCMEIASLNGHWCKAKLEETLQTLKVCELPFVHSVLTIVKMLQTYYYGVISLVICTVYTACFTIQEFCTLTTEYIYEFIWLPQWTDYHLLSASWSSPVHILIQSRYILTFSWQPPLSSGKTLPQAKNTAVRRSSIAWLCKYVHSVGPICRQ